MRGWRKSKFVSLQMCCCRKSFVPMDRRGRFCTSRFFFLFFGFSVLLLLLMLCHGLIFLVISIAKGASAKCSGWPRITNVQIFSTGTNNVCQTRRGQRVTISRRPVYDEVWDWFYMSYGGVKGEIFRNFLDTWWTLGRLAEFFQIFWNSW